MTVGVKLQDYLRLGGLLEYIDLKTTVSTFTVDDYRYYYKEIIKLNPVPGISDEFYCDFENGDIKRFHSSWIEVQVEVNLKQKYKKSK